MLPVLPTSAIPPSRGAQFVKAAIPLAVNVPNGAPDLQVDFITADIVLNRVENRLSVLEFNGLNSGLSGYDRIYKQDSHSNTNLRRQFYNALSEQGFDLIGITQPNKLSYYPYTLAEEGHLDLLKAGGRVLTRDEFVVDQQPYSYEAQLGRAFDLIDSWVDRFQGQEDYKNIVNDLKKLQLSFTEEDYQAIIDEMALYPNSDLSPECKSGFFDLIAEVLLPRIKVGTASETLITIKTTTKTMVSDPHHTMIIDENDPYFAKLNSVLETKINSKSTIQKAFQETDPKYFPRSIEIDPENRPSANELKKLQSSSGEFVLKITNGLGGIGIFYVDKDSLPLAVDLLYSNVEEYKKRKDFRKLRQRLGIGLSFIKWFWRQNLEGLNIKDNIFWVNEYTFYKLNMHSYKKRAHIRKERQRLGVPLSKVINVWRSHSKQLPLIVQEYVASQVVKSDVSQKLYNGAIRFVFGLARDGENLSFIPLDAYWKLPDRSIPKGRDFLAANSNVHRGEKSLPVSDEDYKYIVDEFKNFLPGVYTYLSQK